MAPKPSCPYWEGHECLIAESKLTLSEFRTWLIENVGEEVESTETLLRIYTHFTLSCLRCPYNPHRRKTSRASIEVEQNLRRLREEREQVLTSSLSA